MSFFLADRHLNAQTDAVDPSARERQIVLAAVARAREFGLRFQPGQVEVLYVRGLTNGARGRAYTNRRPIQIFLRKGLSDWDLFGVALHELRHAWDELNEYDFPYWPIETVEERARTFAARACRGLSDPQAFAAYLRERESAERRR